MITKTDKQTQNKQVFIHILCFLGIKTQFTRNLVDHRPIHDKNYENPCLKVIKLQKF